MARLALVPLAWCFSLAAQTTPPDTLAVVTGSVTNSVTGEPILRGHVLLRIWISGQGNLDTNPQTYGALTNREGKFTVSRLPPGRYSVSADRVGFVMPANARTAGYGMFTLAAGEKKDDLKLTLTPTGAITGRVLDASGEPVPNVNVQAEGGAGSQGATTDDQGAYRIGGLRPGKYRIHASPQQLPFGAEIRTDGTKDVHYSATFYPGVLARASAQRLDVPPAAQLRSIDIRLVSTPIVSVSGKVVGIPAGNSRVGIQVTRAGDENLGGGPQEPVKSDGTFKVSHLDPGKYALAAISFGQGPQRGLASAPVEIEVAGTNIEHIELRMIPPFEVSGQVRFDEERARFPQPPQLPGQPPGTQPPVPVRQIRLQSDAGFMGRELAAEVGSDDSFTLEKVQPGRYRVGLSWGPGYVRSVTVGSTETAGDILDVRNGLAGAVTVWVSGLTCDISGTVNGPGGPAAGAHVVIVPETAGRHFPRLVSTKPDGTYTITGIPPGKYKLAAADDDSYPNLMQPGAAWEDEEAVAETIELRAGDRITKDLKQK
jgi:uncharacterized protein (DUF2141 family)